MKPSNKKLSIISKRLNIDLYYNIEFYLYYYSTIILIIIRQDILIKSNTFTMKYFENGVDNLQARNYMTENTLTPQFRLKGARMS